MKYKIKTNKGKERKIAKKAIQQNGTYQLHFIFGT